MIGAAFLFSGILGSATISLIMCKLMKLKFMVFLCIVVGSIAYIMAFIAFSDKNKVLMILFPAIMGFFLVPVRGLLIQCCCATTRDVSEHVVNGAIKSIYNLGSAAAVFL